MSIYLDMFNCDHKFNTRGACEKCSMQFDDYEWIEELAKLEQERDRLQQERDALLELCKTADVHIGWDDCTLRNVHKKIRAEIWNVEAAIKKVEAGK
jgi:hypothetical protein